MILIFILLLMVENLKFEILIKNTYHFENSKESLIYLHYVYGLLNDKSIYYNFNR